MCNFKEQIKEHATKNLIDIIGFAAKERFEGVDPRYNPFSIFPEGKTVILVGRRITRGTLRGVEEGTNTYDYSAFGSRFLDDQFIAQSCYDVVRFIEDNGWEAVPVFPNPKESYGMGVTVREGNVAPNVTPDFDYAAVACGLGEIGLNEIFLSYEYGPRQRFQMIITDAELESDVLSDESICTKCGKCAAVCPMNAINIEDKKEVTVCGKAMDVANIDYSLCKKCQNGVQSNRFHGAGRPDRIPALCVRTCIHELEEAKKVKNLFENKFRKREAWGFDIYGKNVKVND